MGLLIDFHRKDGTTMKKLVALLVIGGMLALGCGSSSPTGGTGKKGSMPPAGGREAKEPSKESKMEPKTESKPEAKTESKPEHKEEKAKKDK